MDDQYNCHVGKTKVLLKKSYRRRFLLGRAPSGVACRVALSAQTFLPCKKVTAAIAHANRGAGHSPAPRSKKYSRKIVYAPQPLYKQKPKSKECIISIVLQLPEGGDFEALNCLPALNLIEAQSLI
jgi:hypothetical protein